MNNQLYHYGIIGMKWGKRRSPSTNSASGKRINLNKTKSALDDTGKLIKSLKDLDEALYKSSSKTRTDFKHMSDDELKAKVARLNLEQNYARLTEPPISKGRQNVRNALEIGGSVTAIGASSVAIALAIKQLKKG